jgi:hypothetical protein
LGKKTVLVAIPNVLNLNISETGPFLSNYGIKFKFQCGDYLRYLKKISKLLMTAQIAINMCYIVTDMDIFTKRQNKL